MRSGLLPAFPKNFGAEAKAHFHREVAKPSYGFCLTEPDGIAYEVNRDTNQRSVLHQPVS